ncbi:hypothetical protein [Streptomyces odontomachi]|uniref:hypothetical protein n=1 Tax=Streptomyces odontomachi TaxID=2944940 RepID=UPI00210BCB66|nr:hypothetical protein [Streptomyces sp. ODS25]
MSVTGGTAMNAINVTALSQSRSTVVSVAAHATQFFAAAFSPAAVVAGGTRGTGRSGPASSAPALLEPGWQ